MDPNTVTLVVGLGGIVATLISSSLGLYFTAKARSSTLREMLYSRQIDLVTRVISKLGRTRIFVTILTGDVPEHKALARDDLANCVVDLSQLTEEGAAILPTELWVEIKKLSDFVTTVSAEYDEQGGVSSEQLLKLTGMDAKVALVSRSILGVDELTEESLKLFSSKKDFTRLAKIEASAFEKMARDKNA